MAAISGLIRVMERAARKAGGFVSDFRGRSAPIHSEQVLAANDALHSKLHKLLAGALR